MSLVCVESFSEASVYAAEKPTLPEPALVSLINVPEKDVDSSIDRVDAMRILHTTHQLYGYRCPGVLSPSWLARPPPRDANAPPPALPRMRSHALRPRRMGVPNELVGGALVEENGGHARLGLGVEHRLIKQEVVSCARHAKSKSAE